LHSHVAVFPSGINLFGWNKVFCRTRLVRACVRLNLNFLFKVQWTMCGFSWTTLSVINAHSTLTVTQLAMRVAREHNFCILQ
jgi:hypothetical protein